MYMFFLLGSPVNRKKSAFFPTSDFENLWFSITVFIVETFFLHNIGTWRKPTRGTATELKPVSCMKLIKSKMKEEPDEEDRRKMDWRQIKNIMKKESDSGTVKKKETPISSLKTDHSKREVDTGSSLQRFLDHIPISSIPGINNSSVLELKTGDTVRHAIKLLYQKDVFGAPVADILDPDIATRGFSDRYIGFIDFGSMFLWCLQELENRERHTKVGGGGESEKDDFFTMLEQNPDIGETKVGELAQSHLWDPFFPVNLDETLFHVLLLLSKHRLQVVPVIEQSNSKVIGFITQIAVIHLLLQSSGLEWFDSITNKALPEFRFENGDHLVHVYGDQSITEALQALRGSQVGAVAVVDRGDNRLLGHIRSSDVYLLIENDNLFRNRENVTAAEFMRMETGNKDSDPTVDRHFGALFSAGILRLKNSFLPRMDSPVTNKRADTLKQVMENVAEKNSSFSFLVDDLQQPTGMIVLRDVILQYAPPCIDSSIDGGGFFQSALEQTGCHVEDGTLICKH